jgi:membrane-associated phospholipid phosphatase
MNRATLTGAGAAVLFVVFASDLIFHGPVTSADPAISLWLHAHMQPVLTQVLLAVTHMHSTTGLLVMSALIAAFCALRHRARLIPWLLLTVQGGQVLNWLLKEAFRRARPHWDSPLLELSSYSFPSGHSAGSTVFWSFACLLACWWPATPAVRRLVFCLAPVMVAATAFSRVYLGAHYTSDVLAGICEGVAWASACAWLHRSRIAA